MKRNRHKNRKFASKTKSIIFIIILELILTYFCVGWIYDTRKISVDNTVEVVATVEQIEILSGHGKGGIQIDFYTNIGIFNLNMTTTQEQRTIIDSIDQNVDLKFRIRKNPDLLGPYNKTSTFGVRNNDNIYYSFDDAIQQVNLERPFEFGGSVLLWLCGNLVLSVYTISKVYL